MKPREGYRWQPRAWAPNPRQGAILDALIQGRTNAEIGRAVGISADGVKWYVSQFLLETGLTNRRELAGWWRERRLELLSRLPWAHDAVGGRILEPQMAGPTGRPQNRAPIRARAIAGAPQSESVVHTGSSTPAQIKDAP